VDCLVNNVGWAEIHTWNDLTDEVWSAHGRSTDEAVRALRAALPAMASKGRGRSSTSVRPRKASKPLDAGVLGDESGDAFAFALVADLHAKHGTVATPSRQVRLATDAVDGDGASRSAREARRRSS